MYDHNIEEMEDEGVVVRREDPVWMGRIGCIVHEWDTLGCKVTHDLIYPEMCFLVMRLVVI